MLKVDAKTLSEGVIRIFKGKLSNLCGKPVLVVLYGDVFDTKPYFELIDTAIAPYNPHVLSYAVNIGRQYWALQKSYPIDLQYGRRICRIINRNISYVPTQLFVGLDGSCGHFIGMMKKLELELMLSDLCVNEKPTLIGERELEYNFEDF